MSRHSPSNKAGSPSCRNKGALSERIASKLGQRAPSRLQGQRWRWQASSTQLRALRWRRSSIREASGLSSRMWSHRAADRDLAPRTPTERTCRTHPLRVSQQDLSPEMASRWSKPTRSLRWTRTSARMTKLPSLMSPSLNLETSTPWRRSLPATLSWPTGVTQMSSTHVITHTYPAAGPKKSVPLVDLPPNHSHSKASSAEMARTPPPKNKTNLLLN